MKLLLVVPVLELVLLAVTMAFLRMHADRCRVHATRSICCVRMPIPCTQYNPRRTAPQRTGEVGRALRAVGPRVSDELASGRNAGHGSGHGTAWTRLRPPPCKSGGDPARREIYNQPLYVV
jgi:hypothetical protein